MRIATDYEIDSYTGKIICPGELVFDEISINKKIDIDNESRSIEEQEDIINNQINSEENIIITEAEKNINENIEQEIGDNSTAKAKKLKKSVSPEIN